MTFKHENKPFKKKLPLYRIYLDNDSEYFKNFQIPKILNY